MLDQDDEQGVAKPLMLKSAYGRDFAMHETAVFIIVEDSEVVLDDLAEGLRELHPGCVVHGFRKPDAAVAALSDLQRISVALFSTPPEGLKHSGLPDAVRQREGRILLIEGPGMRAVAQAEGWPLLERPFSVETLGDALSSLFCSDALSTPHSGQR